MTKEDSDRLKINTDTLDDPPNQTSDIDTFADKVDRELRLSRNPMTKIKETVNEAGQKIITWQMASGIWEETLEEGRRISFTLIVEFEI